MKRNLLLLLALGLLFVFPSCDGSDDDDDAGDDDDTANQLPIPDPGDGDLAGVWLATDADNSTPGTAFPCGIVSENPLYIEADIITGENAYFVFEADASFDMSFNLGGIEGSFDFIHLHDGNGLVFGAELEPLVVDVAPDMASGTWSVEEGNIYVFEVHVLGGGFF